MDARKYYLGFNIVKGIGPVRLRELRQRFGDLATAWKAPQSALAAVGLDQRTLGNLLQVRQSVNLDEMLHHVEQIGAVVVTLDDPDYPLLLRELPDSPPVLYVKGTLADADQWAVAFVGTRRSTTYGREMAARLAASLVQAGITIVSGLARGIDGAAHKAALEAGGRTLAVLGSGIDVIYPPEHRKLAEEIIQNGALVTEFPPGTPPDGRNFPVRNRIISGLSLGVVVVEAPQDSGALLTADCAADQGREVFALPGNVTSNSSLGANRLIQSGAKLVITAEDILEELNLSRSVVETRTQVRQIVPSDPIEALLARHLALEPVHIDELCQLTSLPITQVSSTLAIMELKGLVQRMEGMTYSLARGGGETYRLD
ncbi:MAG: DNA-protecting protein DprA [Chloroflexi bacterium]|nr:DNA-protecting protein DprA [Chloroflexota bacterium]